MRHGRLSVVFPVCCLVIAAAWLPGCRKAPDEQPEPQPTAAAVQETRSPITSLDLPQSNQNLDVTLTSLPPGLVVTLNDSYWLELTDAEHPSIRYTFIGNPPGQPGVAPATPAEFEERVRQSPRGRVLETGSLKTKLGTATWVAGTYEDDDGPVTDIHLFVPRPADKSSLVVSSVCPPDAATVEDRVSVIADLVDHAS